MLSRRRFLGWVPAALMLSTPRPVHAVRAVTCRAERPGAGSHVRSDAIDVYDSVEVSITGWEFPIGGMVTNDGTLSLPFLRQPLRVRGLTEQQLSVAIATAYAEKIRPRPRPDDVTIRRVRSSDTPWFRIGGGVQRPGEYMLEPELRLSQAVALAGGLKPGFDGRTVRIFVQTCIRPIRKYDLRKITAGTKADVIIERYDNLTVLR